LCSYPFGNDEDGKLAREIAKSRHDGEIELPSAAVADRIWRSRLTRTVQPREFGLSLDLRFGKDVFTSFSKFFSSQKIQSGFVWHRRGRRLANI